MNTSATPVHIDLGVAWVIDAVADKASFTIDEASATTITVRRGSTDLNGDQRFVVETFRDKSVLARHVVKASAVVGVVLDEHLARIKELTDLVKAGVIR